MKAQHAAVWCGEPHLFRCSLAALPAQAADSGLPGVGNGGVVSELLEHTLFNRWGMAQGLVTAACVRLSV